MIDTAVRDTLRHAAAVGPYFAVETDSNELDRPHWRSFDDLRAPATVADRVYAVRTSLAGRSSLSPEDVDRRAAASTYLLGLVSRLVSPALATAALDGIVLACPPADLRWRPMQGGPVPIGFRSAAARVVADVPAAARGLHDAVLDPLVRPLIAAMPDVSPIVLWGNVASALAGAGGILASTGSTFVLDPVDVVASALRIGTLVGTGDVDVPDRFFERTSCCLLYRVPGFATCGDCVLDRAAHQRVTRRRQ